MGSLEDNFSYTLMGKSHLMLYPYITLILRVLSGFFISTRLNLENQHYIKGISLF